ncbi:MAG TPA: aspartate-semialdehyde dehydrogenase [Bacteroidota bacterium]|nr:aspartate-semialdehyde dehydrogenase [Bacteroidota bacterium]
MKLYDVAVVGATGLVGRTMIRVLEERHFPVNRLLPLASERSVGKQVTFQGKPVNVEKLTAEKFKGIQYALFSAGAGVSKEFAPHAAAAGAVVIDNSSAFRMDDGVPLVVPEVNPHQAFNHKGIIANPNCSTIQMVVVLKPLHDRFTIKRVVVSTYQSVTGAGQRAVAQLEDEVAGRPLREKKFPHPIAYNCLPHIDVFFDDGYTKEELKMKLETKKIMEADIPVTATTVRVPVMGGHSESVNIEFEKPCSVKEVRELLKSAPGIVVQDDPSSNLYPMPLTAFDKDEVFVGRIRMDETVAHGINLWIVSDNIRKGAATNAVQIAETLIARL